MAKRTLITGVTGQDGSYLAELLLEKGYEVHGLVRRVALEDPSHKFSRINHIKDDLYLHSGTLESYSRLIEIFENVKPDECYHLAAQSFVHESFDDGFSTLEINIKGTRHVLSALRHKVPDCKFYFAASSEMFGKVHEVPQKETTRFHPRSPYGVSKVDGFFITTNFRESYNIFACNGILFNHESPRRGFEFVTRKISSGVASIKNGKDNILLLGNLDAKRDWGFAGDYVRAMWLMLQQDKPDDYVIATGETHTVKEFVDLAFEYTGLDYELKDLHKLPEKKADERVRDLRNQKDKIFLVQHPTFFRPAEVDLLKGDASKANKELGWEPQVSFEELVAMMVEHDLKNYQPNPK
ncbi:GDP-mannose 4,6 dehydratase [Euryarchaeota archaeon SM23-78]|nr:MAG: GDP-mannose 4,6 dehydratase [Euryarchaeota archaeon SM23-78]